MHAPDPARQPVRVALGAVVENVSPAASDTPAHDAPHTPNKRAPDAQKSGAARPPRLLITRRSAQQVLAGLWELPGGKVDGNESPRDAVVRELREEVGIEVRPLQALPAVEHDYEHARVQLLAFICERIAGEPRAIQVDDVRWVGLDELAGYDFPEATLPVLAALREALGCSATM